MTARPPLFSVVVPMRDEAASVLPLAREIAEACGPVGPFEAIFVDDGSVDGTGAALAEAAGRHAWLRTVRHDRPRGQSAAIRTGVLASAAAVICTLDGDGQNPPEEIPRLVAPLLGAATGARLIAGQRRHRKASPARRIASRLANLIRGAVLADGVRDSACGLKAFPRSLFLSLPFFEGMHRYLPALARAAGAEVILIDVADRPRLAGRSKYTIPGRAVAGAISLPRVWRHLRRRRGPGQPMSAANPPSSNDLRRPDSSDTLSRSKAAPDEAARNYSCQGQVATGEEET
jgi:dolichol-phosphate mannosyltransferase